MQIKFLFFLILSLPIFSIAQESIPDSSKMVTLRIDPANARGGSVSDVFSEVEFIPLETTKESLFGKIDRLEVVDDNFVFFDRDTKAVYVFAKNGKFRTKIDESKTHSKNFNSFKLAKLSNEDCIQIKTNENQLYFTLAGVLLKTVPNGKSITVDDPKTFFTTHTNYVATGVRDTIDATKPLYEIVTYKNGNIIGQYFKVPPPKIGTYSFFRTYTGVFDSGIKDQLYFLRPKDYNVYLATANKVSIAYRFVFPLANTLPKDFDINPKYDDAVRWLTDNAAVIYGIGNTFLLDNLFFFKAESRNGRNNFVYYLKEKSLISIEDLQPDTTSQFLPISGLGTDNFFKSVGLNTLVAGNFYTSTSSLVMFSVYEQQGITKHKLDPRLTKYFAEQNRKSNPVIIRLKPKTD